MLAVASGATVVSGQAKLDERLEIQLKQLFPTAVAFSGKELLPLPHFKVFVPDANGQPTLGGFAFWTTELEPLERGYDGPIKMLVGLDLKGVIAGVVVAGHREPFGKFSVDPPRFSQQFKGKSVRDPFKPGEDVDAIATATITINSATRSIKKSARRVAAQMLRPDGGDK